VAQQLPFLDALAANELASLSQSDSSTFLGRIDVHRPDLMRTLGGLYGDTHDIEELFERFVRLAATRYVERSDELKRLDLKRLAEPDWFQSQRMVGYAAYVDRFAGDLAAVPARIPYLGELGVTYLHLLPFLQAREGESDGGYAVADYRSVDSRFGTMADLEGLTTELRSAGISLCVDVVCNHTADTHEWALKAKAGEAAYQDYYLMFEDRTEPDRYEHTLREVFPEAAPGNFTWVDEVERWVWTTFRTYQWDLNYRNPAVLGEMADVIFNLANTGAEVLRLDAVAFMWKQMGTMSENLPQAHLILQFFRAITRLTCPGVILKAEAIVPIAHRRHAPVSRSRPSYRQGMRAGVPPLPDGPDVVGAGRAERQARRRRTSADTSDRPVAQRLVHVRALTRRHRLGDHPRGRRNRRAQRLRAPQVPHRVLHRGLPDVVCARRGLRREPEDE
jgi:amylosucrase